MAYVTINGMRSTRFPLQGLGCPCTPAISGLGQEVMASPEQQVAMAEMRKDNDAMDALDRNINAPVVSSAALPGEPRSMTPLVIGGAVVVGLWWMSRSKKIEANRRRRRRH